MSTPKSIPSRINIEENVVPPSHIPRCALYITAILYPGPIKIDGIETDVSPLSLPSPIFCHSFTAGIGQVAYYYQ